MNKIVVITGANKGLGKAFLDIILLNQGTKVLSLSREIHEDHKSDKFNNLYFIPTDLSQPFTETSLDILDQFIAEESVIFLINNAGSIVPINRIGAFTSSEIEDSIAINVNYTVHLVNCLLRKYSNHNISIVNISSGAAHYPIAYWSLYGAAKAYIASFLNILEVETKSNIRVFNIDPGVLDTGMQKIIRESEFPKQKDFKELKSNDKLVKPADAAARILNEVDF